MRKSIRVLSLACAAAGVLCGQIVAIEASPNNLVGSIVGSASVAPHEFIGVTTQVFPHIATGGGWETVVVIVNMGTVTTNFVMRFFGEDGTPMAVTFKSFPDLALTTTPALQGTLPPKASFNFSLFDSTPNTQIGWATLEYAPSTTQRIGAYSIFRQLVTGRPDFEALSPLSPYDDYKFYMPFDNIQGFLTAIALVNPSSNVTDHVSITALATDGVTIIDQTTITLPPGGHSAFVLADKLPKVANKLGTLYVQGDTNRLSAIGLRFNGSGGFSFASIPIMNWDGMFP